MRYSYDLKSDTYLIEITPGETHRTIENEGVTLELDKHGWLLNIRMDRPTDAFLNLMRHVVGDKHAKPAFSD